MKKLNLNSIIKVKLTDYGKEIFYHQFDELNEFIGKEYFKPEFPKVDSEGYSKFLLWDFMHVYGKPMIMGAPNVIEPLNIYINDNDLVEE